MAMNTYIKSIIHIAVLTCGLLTTSCSRSDSSSNTLEPEANADSIKSTSAAAALVVRTGGYARDTHAAIDRLDSVIRRRPDIEKEKQLEISKARQRVIAAESDEERLNNMKLYIYEYRKYNLDTLLALAQQWVKMAQEIGNDSMIWRARLMEAEGLKGTGQFFESLRMLDSFPAKWKKAFRARLLNRYVSIYYSLSDMAVSPVEKELWTNRLNAYRDSIIMESEPGSLPYWMNLIEYHSTSDPPAKTLAEIDAMPGNIVNEADPGVLAYIRGRTLERLGRRDEAKYHYAIGAAFDLGRSVRKYESLLELSRMLSEDGDDTRAYRYIMMSLDDMRSSNARGRMRRVVEYMPIVASAYSSAEASAQRLRTIQLTTVTALAIALAVAIFFFYKKNRRLVTERRRLHYKNEELEHLRTQLSEANVTLEESAKVKERYLGYLFNLCSDYIGSLDRYRLSLLQRVKAGKMKDITEILAAPQGNEHLQSFFKQFDQIFLDMFPDFIEKLNALLTPDYSLTPKPGELLSPELRIYALVRLGISDSTQIAAFLHYSPQTVYNYRFRVRSHSSLSKEEFDAAVREL